VQCNSWLQSMGDQVECLNPLSLTTPWDPGVLVILHSYTGTHRIVTHPGAFTHVLQSIFASATECYYVFCLGWIEVKTATVLVLVVPHSKGKCIARHSLCSCQLVIVEQIINFLWCATSVHVTKQKLPLDVLLMAETLHNLSKLREVQLNCSGMNVGLSFIQFLQTSCEWIHKIITAVSVRPLIELHHSYGRLYTKTASLDGLDIEEQPTYMCHSTMLNSSKLLRHMVTVLSCSLASFGNRSNLQWDPGIAFVYQQGVHKDYNAPNLLPTENCLQILEMNIILVTFLPP
jgi:hypothetical protein